MDVTDPAISDLEITDSSCKVRLPVFEGPLDLLLSLIKKNKIDIYDIPIAFITNQYLQYLSVMKELNLDIAGEFLVIAATLIQIKSRMLLPIDEQSGGEEEEDPRLELVQKLLEYQSFKEVAYALKDKEEQWENIFTREPSVISDSEPCDDPGPYLFNLNLYDLLEAIKVVLERKPVEAVLISKETLTIKDKIAMITSRLALLNEIEFKMLTETLDGLATRTDVIVTFLAILEMLRLGIIYVYQERDFGEILIRSSVRPKELSQKGLTQESSPE